MLAPFSVYFYFSFASLEWFMLKWYIDVLVLSYCNASLLLFQVQPTHSLYTLQASIFPSGWDVQKMQTKWTWGHNDWRMNSIVLFIRTEGDHVLIKVSSFSRNFVLSCRHTPLTYSPQNPLIIYFHVLKPLRVKYTRQRACQGNPTREVIWVLLQFCSDDMHTAFPLGYFPFLFFGTRQQDVGGTPRQIPKRL